MVQTPHPTTDQDAEEGDEAPAFDWGSMWGRVNKGKLATEATEALLRFGVRSVLGPRRGAPVEDLIGVGTKMVRQGFGISDRWMQSGAADETLGPVSDEVAAQFWGETVPGRQWSIELLCGAQGSGKSVLMALLCEIYERNGKRSLWLGADQEDLDSLPLDATALTLEDGLRRMVAMDLRGEVLVIDDAVQFFNAYSSQTRESQALHAFLAVGVRKTDSHVLIATQETGLIAKHGMQPSVVWSKPPLGNFEDFERGAQLKRSRRAVRAYQRLDAAEWVKWCYVEECGAIGSFRGLVPVRLPTGWNERMSRAM